MSFATSEIQLEWKKVLASAGCLYIASSVQNTYNRVCHGFAEKLGEKVKNWNERYFCLYESGDIEYFEGVKKTSAENTICEDVSKARSKGVVLTRSMKFKCPPHLKDHPFAISIELKERDFLISFDSKEELEVWKKGMIRTGAIYYDPYTKIDHSLEMKNELKRLSGKKISMKKSVLMKPLIWGLVQKTGEGTKTFSERFFVFYTNCVLEYHKNIKYVETTQSLPDLTHGDLKGKVNIRGCRFKISKDDEMVMIIQTYGRNFDLKFGSVEQMAAWKKMFTDLKIAQYDVDLKVVLFGEFEKQGERIRNWQMRYFLLWSNGDLEYYKGVKDVGNEIADYKKGELKGKLPLLGCDFKVLRDQMNKDYIIEINSKERDFRFAPSDKYIMAKWRDALIDLGCNCLDNIEEFEEVEWLAFTLADKMGEKFKTWQQRYFVLHPTGILEYYKVDKIPKDWKNNPADLSKAELKGSVSVKTCCFQVAQNISGRPDTIQIELTSGRNLQISFKDTETLLEWKKILPSVDCDYYRVL